MKLGEQGSSMRIACGFYVLSIVAVVAYAITASPVISVCFVAWALLMLPMGIDPAIQISVRRNTKGDKS